MKRIRAIPTQLRPREKLLKQGVAALSLEELISVVLITGTKELHVGKIAQQITKIIKKPELSLSTLERLHIGPSKIAQILAAVELGKRLLAENKTVTLTKAEEVVAQSYEIVNAEKESLLCFYLNARGELVKKEIVAVGSLNRASLLPREIFSLIKELPVASIILVHNHPSGNLDASDDDLVFTQRVKQADDILGVRLLDHLIVSSKGWRRI